MGFERSVARKPAAEPRSAAPAVAERARGASLQPHASQVLQRRLGARGTAAYVARQATGIQASSLNISSAHDPAEREATATAATVMRMSAPALTEGAPPQIQRDSIGPATTSPQVTAGIHGATGGGAPLAPSVRTFMEPRFNADFSRVRVHTGEQSETLNREVNAKAFTVGEHVFFGKGSYHPDTRDGKELIAHELTHTIQQGAAVQRSEQPQVTQESPATVQRLGISDALNYFADKANLLPGFRMLTVILGMNPINMTAVARTPANILRALIEVIPGGVLLSQALENAGIFDKVGAWITQQVEALGLTAAAIKASVTQFLDTLSWRDIFDLGGVWERAKAIFTAPINRLIAWAGGVAGAVIQFVKDAILMPIANLASQTRGWDLLIAVLGRNPITGAPVPRTAETLIPGFLKLIGKEQIWQNMVQAKAIPRAWAWFQGALTGIVALVSSIPERFKAAFASLELLDIILIPKAYAKIAGVFAGFILDFIGFAGNAVWTLLELIFEVVSPETLKYIKKTGAALKSILMNPLPFANNLVKAALLGFQNFADHFGQHLKAGLIDWLTGSLPGVYIPKAFELGEIVKFVFSVLGISWANIRQKLVAVIGEPAVKVLETTFDIVVTLVKDGPAAAWEKIKEQLTSLKDMVVNGIIEFVVTTVVQKAIPKLIAMFIPGAGFISAIVTIYDTIMVFVNKISQIIQVVTAFIDSIVEIAGGAIVNAANKVEGVLARLLSLAINFLAGFLGLGKVADKIMDVIKKVRAVVDKGIDALINWIVTAAKSLGRLVAQAGLPQDPNERLRLGLDAATTAAKALGGRGLTRPLLQPVLAGIKVRYGFKDIDAFERGGTWWVRGVINPEAERNMGIIVVKEGEEGAPAPSTLEPMPLVPITFDCNIKKYVKAVYDEQLKGQETGLNAISVADWEKNRKEYDKNGRGSSVPQEEVREQYKKDLKASGKKSDAQIEAEMERLAALHEPDLVAGGFNVIGKLGSRYINSSIGSQWRTRVEKIEKAVANLKDDKPKKRINVSLTSVAVSPD